MRHFVVLAAMCVSLTGCTFLTGHQNAERFCIGIRQNMGRIHVKTRQVGPYSPDKALRIAKAVHSRVIE
jgi:hypothetical protein